ncbi:MAG: zinc ribbon domain-containing protein [Nostoc sp.]|uniref:zinc ribbon domain-containing protein n=1 Tax=Nostoc sp. TaxID=1180 RepID=UPI002FF15243
MRSDIVKKSLSTRTHSCLHCGTVLDRDQNAALNILEIGLRTVGHTGTLTSVDENDLYLGDANPPSKPTRRSRKPKKATS